MVWKNMFSKTNTPIVMLLALLPGVAITQTMEAEWRVTNTVSPTSLPDYVNQPNPFPIQAEPERVAVEEPVTLEISEAERTKAEVLARARALISSNAVFRADLSHIIFDGYMKGLKGEKVLSKGKWYGMGGKFTVPVKGVESAYQTIQNLRDLDPTLADEVTRELNARLSSSNKLELKIINISNKEIILTGSGETYKIPVRQGSY